MPTTPSASVSSTSTVKRTRHLDDYWLDSQQPLQALIFLLPLIALYEISIFYHGTDHLFARNLLRRLFEPFGVTGYHLPAITVVIVLTCWHFARKDRFRFQPEVYAGMALESCALALPLLVLALVLFRELAGPTAIAATTSTDWRAELINGIGAGIYEELLFRLVIITSLHMLLVDGLALPGRVGSIIGAIVSAVAFALSHFDFGNHPFEWSRFLFYAIAGIHFATVFLFRGFGVAAGTHTAYNLMTIALSSL